MRQSYPHYRSSFSRFVLCFALVLGPASALAQKRFALELDGSALPAATQQEIKDTINAVLRGKSPEAISLTGQQGPFGINAACPSGFVSNANHQFSGAAVLVTRNEGSDCDGGQCRSWTIEAHPEEELATYDFSLTLHCTADNALRSRPKPARQEATVERRAAQ